MPDSVAVPRPVRFGPFELEPRSGELRNGVRRQHLADQPLALLKALLERPGELVTRDELRQRLWPDGTFVDFDHGLNSAVNRLREALSDSADTPCVVETIPRRGYRLLVGVDATPAAAAVQGLNTRRVRPWIAAAALVGISTLAGLGWWARPAPPAPGPLVANVAIDLPEGWLLLKNLAPAISPNSEHIAISALQRSGRSAIWLRPLGGRGWRMLRHTDNGSGPFWSPDGRAIGFFAEGKLKIVTWPEESVQSVCDAPPGSGTWITSSLILFAPGRNGGVDAVDLVSGQSRSVTSPDLEAGEVRHGVPRALPDGRHFTYVAQGRDSAMAMLGSLDGAGPAPLGTVQSPMQPTVSSRVLFVRDGALLTQTLDVSTGRLTGDSTILADGLTAPGWLQDGRFSVSPAMLIYETVFNPFPLSELKVFDRSGNVLRILGEAGRYSSLSLSPDGGRLAVAVSQPSTPARDIWVFDLVRAGRTRLTHDPHDDLAPFWSADGQWLLFTSDRRGKREIYRRRVSGEGAEEIVFESAGSNTLNAWSPDGRLAVFDTGAFNGVSLPDLYQFSLAGARSDVVVSKDSGAQHQATISSDGRFIAYASSQSGRYEVIVETFPNRRGRWQISTDGGQNPIWRGDGLEIFYTAGDQVMAMDVRSSAVGGFEWGPPRALFKIPNLSSAPVRSLTASSDGQRFIAAVPVGAVSQQRLTTVLNWTALLE